MGYGIECICSINQQIIKNCILFLDKVKRSCVYCKLPSQHLNYNQFRKHLIKRKNFRQNGIHKKHPVSNLIPEINSTKK